MSTHTYPDDPAISLLAVWADITAALVAPKGITRNEAAGTVTFTFTPDLTTAQVTTLNGLLADEKAVADLGLPLSLAQYQARKADVVTLRTFMALPTPTQAQSLAALQALIRIVAALVRLQLA